MSVVVDAVARGKRIECDDLLPFGEGERVRVSVDSLEVTEPKRGSAAAILRAVRKGPRLSSDDVDELKRSIAESKLPPSPELFSDND